MATTEQRHRVRNALTRKESENVAGSKRKITLMDRNRHASSDLRGMLGDADVWASCRDSERKSQEAELLKFQERLRKSKAESVASARAAQALVRTEAILQRRNSERALALQKKSQDDALRGSGCLLRRRSHIDAASLESVLATIAASERRRSADDAADMDADEIQGSLLSRRSSGRQSEGRSRTRSSSTSSSKSTLVVSGDRSASPVRSATRSRRQSMHDSNDSGFYEGSVRSVTPSARKGSLTRDSISSISDIDPTESVSFTDLTAYCARDGAHSAGRARVRDAFGGSAPHMDSRGVSPASCVSSARGSRVGVYAASSLVSMAEECGSQSSLCSELSRLPSVRGLVQRPSPIRRRSSKNLGGSVTP